MIATYIGLGSNLEGPMEQLVQAMTELDELSASRLVRTSSLYRSKPLGPQDQPDFINAVVSLETSLPALDLLDELQAIESAHRRVRAERWGPRTLDLDLLVYGEEEIDHVSLKVPHPEIAQRNFVLVPLYEIAPGLTIPGMGQIAKLVKRSDPHGLEVIRASEYSH